MLIDIIDLENSFISGLKKMCLPPLPWKPFHHYLEEMQKWNERINLTAITNPVEIIERHFLDSLSILTVIDDMKCSKNDKNVPRETFCPTSGSSSQFSLLDIGTGAGFPGIPIKIALPDVHVTLVEPIKKRVDFLKQVIRRLGLDGISVLHRGVDEGVSIGRYDIVTSRATFKLDEFISLASSQAASGGFIVAMKSTTEEVSMEIRHAELLLPSLSFSPFKIYDYTLPFSNAPRQLLVTVKQ